MNPLNSAWVANQKIIPEFTEIYHCVRNRLLEVSRCLCDSILWLSKDNSPIISSGRLLCDLLFGTPLQRLWLSRLWASSRPQKMLWIVFYLCTASAIGYPGGDLFTDHNASRSSKLECELPYTMWWNNGIAILRSQACWPIYRTRKNSLILKLFFFVIFQTVYIVDNLNAVQWIALTSLTHKISRVTLHREMLENAWE